MSTFAATPAPLYDTYTHTKTPDNSLAESDNLYQDVTIRILAAWATCPTLPLMGVGRCIQAQRIVMGQRVATAFSPGLFSPLGSPDWGDGYRMVG